MCSNRRLQKYRIVQKIVALTLISNYVRLNLLNTSEIPLFPEDVIIGWSEIRTDLTTNFLSKEELEQFRTFTNEQRKGEYLTGRYIFRELAKQQNWNPEDIKLKKEPLGKPYVEWAEGRKYVSFSHSKNMVICAVSESKDIGLDTESLDRNVNPEVVKRILSENEWKVLGEENPIKLWTMKEAAVKSIGTGLRTNLKDLEMKKKEEAYFEIVINNTQKLEGVTFEALNHCIALAW